MGDEKISKKKKYLLIFPAAITTDPVTYNLVKAFDLKINILKGEINSGEAGNLLVEFDGEREKIDKALHYLRKVGVECSTIEKRIAFQEEDCLHCGSCTAVCFAGALSLEQGSKKVEFVYDKCVGCELCVKACPLFLLQIDLGS